MDKLKMHSVNKVDENVAKIGQLFPNCVTERKKENGEVEYAVDFDMLRQELSSVVVEGNEERYQFTWPDKKKAVLAANAPISATLRPCREESVDFDTTQNLYIEGDNLDVLKLLQETYLGKIKMIYIDPPYNTGNDFVYNDDFAEDAEEYLANSGQYDGEGNRLVQNTESNGRFHTDWLNMIYQRLKVSRDLLSEDGVIFVSINDCEQENLKQICNEIFGKNNFIGCFCWKTDGNFDNQARIKSCHEYILVYAKNEESFPAPPVIDPSIPKTSKLFREEVRNTIVKNGPKNPICGIDIPRGFPCELKDGLIKREKVKWPQYSDDIVIQDYSVANSVSASSGWSSHAQLLDFINNSFNPVHDSKGQETTFILTKTGAIESIKKRTRTSHVISVLEKLGGTQKATIDLGELAAFFDYPKPVALIKYLCSMIFHENETIILDFFSGSATTAHAVMQLNAEDGGHRKFIMVQLPEATDPKSEAYKAGYKNICEIGKERIRRSGQKIKEENPLTTQDLDIGFRVLKLDSSNMKDVYYTSDAYTRDMFDMLAENIKEDRTPEDLLFQVMLDLGIPLSSKIEESVIAGKKVFKVEGNYLIACFDSNLTEETIKAIAQQHPYYYVMRDSSMANDSVAANFDQIFATYSPDTDRKVL